MFNDVITQETQPQPPLVSPRQYKIDTTVNGERFSAEGDEVTVREDFAMWLEAIKNNSVVTLQTSNNQSDSNPKNELPTDESFDDMEHIWTRVYSKDKNGLSLLVLPSNVKTRNAESIILILYGYLKLLKQDAVKSTTIMEAAKQSGLRIDRIDRNIPASHNIYIIKGGSGKGSRYSLNNRGIQFAQEKLEQIVE